MGAVGTGAASAVIATGPAVDEMLAFAAFDARSEGRVCMSLHAVELAGINPADAAAAETVPGATPLRVVCFSAAALARVTA